MPSATFDHLNSEKKDRVLAALLTEFSDHSLADAQVARIVTTAGIARGAFYKYFDDLTDAYQTLYRQALTTIHQGFALVSTAEFNPEPYYQAVVSFVEQSTNSQYDEFIRRHYSENESLLPVKPAPADLPVADWAAMVLSHATIKEIMLQPASHATALARFKQALDRLAE